MSDALPMSSNINNSLVPNLDSNNTHDAITPKQIPLPKIIATERLVAPITNQTTQSRVIPLPILPSKIISIPISQSNIRITPGIVPPPLHKLDTSSENKSTNLFPLLGENNKNVIRILPINSNLNINSEPNQINLANPNKINESSFVRPLPSIKISTNISNGLKLQILPKATLIAPIILPTKEELIKIGMKYLTPFQVDIVNECVEKGNGGMSLPMGTGKTIISTIVSLMQVIKYIDGKILVIAAKSLINTWKEELLKFFGNSIKFEIFHKESIKNNVNWVPTGDIIITTPETVSKIYTKLGINVMFSYTERPENFGPEVKYYRVPENPYLSHTSGDGYLYSIKWGSIIVDEAHNYLNPKSARCLAVASLCSHHRWLLSGTLLAEPKSEKLLGYHLMLNHPGSPRNLPGFKEYIYSDDYKGISNTFVKRDENIDFHPPKINKQIISHSLSKTEALIYTNVKTLLGILKNRLKEYKRNNDKVNTKKFSSYIMGMITHMRQCLVCPLIPITTVAIDVADLEQRSELSEIFMNHINQMGIDDWLNDINSLKSSRITSVCERVDQHKNERLIIFSCYRTVLDVINIFLPKDRPIFTIRGNDNIEKRKEIIENFRLSNNGIILLTYEIGANGLNLQCSSTALIVDFWWNKGKSDQAVSRLLRPGQQSAIVNLYYFTSNTGMENAIFKLQESKLSMGEEILTGRMTTTIQKIRVDDIIRLINTHDNIIILGELID